MKKIDCSKILCFLKTFLRTIVLHHFLFTIGLIVFAFLLNNYLFYTFYISPTKTESVFINDIIGFDEELHNEIMYRWDKKEKSFIEADNKVYFDPFYPNYSLKNNGVKRLSEKRTEELLSNPNIRDLLKASNLYEFYKNKGQKLLMIEDRAEIWEELDLGLKEDYRGEYEQNMLFLEELKKELTD